MKLIFKKRIGAFNVYSNGRVYADIDKMFKKKPKRRKRTLEDMQQQQQDKLQNIENKYSIIQNNIQYIKDRLTFKHLRKG